MRSNVCAFLAILLCTSATAPAFAAASLTPLGSLGGGYDIRAHDVSGDGTVVVGLSYSPNGQAFRWTSDGGIVGLGYLPGGFHSQASGVSADGSVIVGGSTYASGFEAFHWTSGGGMVGLGILPSDSYSNAYGVSGDGSVVVGHSGHSASGRQEAFRWTSDGGMVGLGYLPGGAFESLAWGVSADGSVIVGGSNSASGFEAFRWTSDGGMVGLGDLPGGWFSSHASGVSADGSVIVGVGTSDSGLEAFRWTSDGGMVSLGNLPGAINSWADGVSADGAVVVGWSQFDSGPMGYTDRAFYWTADGGMRELWDVLLSHGVDPGAEGWSSLGIANGISADGNTIVGYGTRNGNTEAFVAVIPVVPEPAAGALALLGLGSVLLLRRRYLWRTKQVPLGARDFLARSQIMRSDVCAFLAVLLCTSAADRAFAAASLTPLGFLPGGTFHSAATSVSADGSTVVGFSGLGARQEAFRWTSGGGMVGLGDLPGGNFESLAFGVSADGSVVVGYGTWGSIFSREAFRWTSDGGMVGLGDLPGGTFTSEAFGVSADGSVVVGVSSSASGGEAFRWTSGGGMVGMGFSVAYDVNGDGSVVVGSGGSATRVGFEAVRWTSDGGKVGLGVLPGGNSSAAFGVSADGSVVVGWSRTLSAVGFGPEFEAFRWTSDSGMVGLGALPGDGFESFAYDVSGDGSVVVGFSGPTGGEEAFLWTNDGGMKRLWDVLLAQGIDPAADGWTKLTIAEGISADGNTIVGSGTRNGNTEAFVAVIPTIVPEPAAGALALLGVSSILLLRRRSLGRTK